MKIAQGSVVHYTCPVLKRTVSFVLLFSFFSIQAGDLYFATRDEGMDCGSAKNPACCQAAASGAAAATTCCETQCADPDRAKSSYGVKSEQPVLLPERSLQTATGYKAVSPEPRIVPSAVYELIAPLFILNASLLI